VICQGQPSTTHPRTPLGGPWRWELGWLTFGRTRLTWTDRLSVEQFW